MLSYIRKVRLHKYFLRHLPYEYRKDFVEETRDPVRYAAIKLAIKRLQKNNVEGAFAELGVFQGTTSRYIQSLAPEREFYLFDTFEGFPQKDLEVEKDGRFKRTSVEAVLSKFPSLDRIHVRKGYFPETAAGLEELKFAFVMLDADLLNPTLSGLEFFYPRLSEGGYIFVHDYNSPESNWAVSRAVDAFLEKTREPLFELPDKCGSVVLQKSRTH